MKKKNSRKALPLIVVVDDKRWTKACCLQAKLEQAADVVLAGISDDLKSTARRAEFTLLLTNDKAIKELNYDFRGQNKPTNVLSFPQFTRSQLKGLGRGKGPVYLGDVAMAFQYTADEAAKEGKFFCDHAVHLLIHGLLHLFGYDHMTALSAVRMERLETTLMAELGLPDPYAPVERTVKGKRA